MKKSNRRTIMAGVSFQSKVWDLIKHKSNRSGYINQAILEKHHKELTKEGKISILKKKRKKLAMEINKIDEKIEILEE